MNNATRSKIDEAQVWVRHYLREIGYWVADEIEDDILFVRWEEHLINVVFPAWGEGRWIEVVTERQVIPRLCYTHPTTAVPRTIMGEILAAERRQRVR